MREPADRHDVARGGGVARRERDEHLVVAEVVEHEAGRRRAPARRRSRRRPRGRGAPSRRPSAASVGLRVVERELDVGVRRRGTRRRRAGRARRRRSGTRRGAAGRRAALRWSSSSPAARVELLAQDRGVAGERPRPRPSGGRRARSAPAAASRPPSPARRPPARRRTACSRARSAAAVIEPSRATASKTSSRRGSSAATSSSLWVAAVCFVGAARRRGGTVEAMTTLHTLRVFLGPDGEGGNPLGVFPDGQLDRPRRPPGASPPSSATPRPSSSTTARRASCGSSRRRSSSRSPGIRWSAPRGCSAPTCSARPPATSPRGPRAGSPGSAPGRSGRRSTTSRSSPRRRHVDAFAIPGGDAMVGVWAWEDEAAGRLRARIFPNGIGIDEDEATGAAAIQFGALLGRDVVHPAGRGLRAARAARAATARSPWAAAWPSSPSGSYALGGRGLTSCAAVDGRDGGDPLRRPRHAPGRRAPQAARRGRRAADRLARGVDLRRARASGGSCSSRATAPGWSPSGRRARRGRRASR